MIVDINCDLGEGVGNEEEILPYITSANIACGFHAGDATTMMKTVETAARMGVKIGAHPGLPDKEGFGRMPMSVSLEEIKSFVVYQIGALEAFAKVAGVRLNHIKLHGALYNMASIDYEISKIVTDTIYQIDKEIIFIGLYNSPMIQAAKDSGLQYLNEVFADRAYNSDGTLVSRQTKGSVLEDVDTCVSRAMRMLNEGKVTSIDGIDIDIKPDTICVHGDGEQAVLLAKKLSQAIRAGY
ncbi:MAG: LamB/YcsF family protein [Dethiosulfatibacter sp.]|nr:LamB/YcsF family protein [Dethiosulfatibacter sp.]